MVPPELQKLLALVRTALSSDAKAGALVDHALIEQTVFKYGPLAAPGLDNAGAAVVVAELEKLFDVWKSRAGVLQEHSGAHRDWLPLRREGIDWRFWGRYQQYSEHRLPPMVVQELDDSTDTVLGLLEDPARTGSWRRQGLIVGHVQSGKTAHYTGLICKAADAGYKVVVVLSGIHNSLRAQTQIRLDDGFLGYARPFDGSARAGAPTGVGLLGVPAIADTITTRDEKGDFSGAKAKGFQIHAGGNVLLFVVKKNAKVLRHLLTWVQLNAKTATEDGRKIVGEVPLLVIDDEADQASIDTNHQPFDEAGNPDPDHSPKAINQLIRGLLMAFERCAYVGYTATPFANVFVHPRAATVGHGPDLFPRDFIINLAPPSNYMGPAQIFSSADDTAPTIGKVPSLVRFIEDADGWSPPRHKSDHRPRYDGADRLPPSLETAIGSFLLSCAARRARGQEREHKSMLIHVTRFTAIQQLVHSQVRGFVDRFRARWQARKVTAGDTLLAEMRALWETDFVPTSLAQGKVPVEWSAVESQVAAVLGGLQVNLINAKASDALIYEEYADTGLTVIAIGGDKLSRGLTLEGLSMSYFLRASRMYDTLMQMGRWFGYRYGYADLCRLYLTEELAEWYAHVTEAADELRGEFDRMVLVGGSPQDYGLRVQSHPVLAITGKLRPGLREIRTSLSATPFEPTIFSEPAVKPNWVITTEFIRSLGAPSTTGGGVRPADRGLAESRGTWAGAAMWQHVPGARILGYLKQFAFADHALTKTPSSVVTKYIEQRMTAGELDNWSVVVLGKETEPGDTTLRFSCPGHPTPLATLQRSRTTERAGLYVVKRVGSPRDEAIDLTREEWTRFLELRAGLSEDAAAREWTRGRLVREVRPKERGLLILYALNPDGIRDAGNAPMIAPYVSFPNSPDAKAVSYTITTVYWEQELGGVE